eukprot:4203600-Pyramimonas_sp.AAC.3
MGKGAGAGVEVELGVVAVEVRRQLYYSTIILRDSYLFYYGSSCANNGKDALNTPDYSTMWLRRTCECLPYTRRRRSTGAARTSGPTWVRCNGISLMRTCYGRTDQRGGTRRQHRESWDDPTGAPAITRPHERDAETPHPSRTAVLLGLRLSNPS